MHVHSTFTSTQAGKLIALVFIKSQFELCHNNNNNDNNNNNNNNGNFICVFECTIVNLAPYR